MNVIGHTLFLKINRLCSQEKCPMKNIIIGLHYSTILKLAAFALCHIILTVQLLGYEELHCCEKCKSLLKGNLDRNAN